MSSTQKITKYFAIALAALIITSIISSIIFGIKFISNVVGFSNNNLTALKDLNIDSENISVLNIKLDVTELIIQKGNNIKVETNNEDIEYSKTDNELVIVENKRNFFDNNNRKIVITLPENFEFDLIDIDSGVGKIEIKELITKKLVFNLGAGKTEINSLTVTESAKIDGGIGLIEIDSGNIKNLNLDLGVGKFSLSSVLIGQNDIDAGVGEVILDIIGNPIDYTIKVNKGIGSIKIDDISAENDSIHGSGVNYLDVKGGVGTIRISFTNK